MNVRTKGVGFALALIGVAAVAYASGLYTNGVPQVGPGQLYSSVNATQALVPMDTQLPQGLNPQTVAATPFQLAGGVAAEMAGNVAAATAGAATLNGLSGSITSEALTTAAGANYTLTLTNSACVAGKIVQVALGQHTNTVGPLNVVSATSSGGTCTIVVQNGGSSPLNGTIGIAFHL
jgi:hypothetical protein